MKNIVIVGGGSAGWMVAAYLAKHTDNNISLIESENVPIVGVGESTIPSIVDFLESIDITENDLFNDCSAVRKYSIQHSNWNGENETWNHRFCYNEKDIEQQDAWMNNYVKPNVKWRWAYHLDATRLGTIIKEKSGIPNGVNHIIDDIVEVVVDGELVKRIVGKKADYIADTFIDCTGFKSLLRSKLPIVKKKHKSLINNCAVCGPGLYQEGETPLPYTQSFAMDYGWRWRVCLQHRTGNGYAFNNNIISVEDAKKEFIAKTPGLNKDKIFVVNIDNSYTTEPWKGNVISFGLSCGFLEPLEATGLFLVYGPLQQYAKLINNPNGQIIFNKLWNRLYRHVSEFVGLIFSSSKLNHTEYWRSIPKVSKIEPNSVNFKDKFWIEYNYQSLANIRKIEYVNPFSQSNRYSD